MEDASIEKGKIVLSVVKSLILVLLIVAVYVINSTFSFNWEDYGLRPRTPEGLFGIVTMTFLHADANHLYANIIPLFLLSFGVFYYFPGKSLPIIILLMISTAIFTWVIGRYGNHIGASGLVYALAFFLVAISIIKMETSMMAFTLIIIFLYGSMIWGFFPQLFPDKHISWEGHLSGALSGLIAAIVYRKEGPQKKEYFLDEEEEVEEEE
ncbi:rhomboid family intramembrane serine protease [Bacteroidales bacterium OttesenSCG-928-B11]|nr:rhomboid family intramembrane serine protease [Bacteroidales bacterium OttesenSCG-928-C03]MDL2311870.1 rhomboid family intramembrane serine protease [Bacteroidales bacterium OttesenSCG-928-B11]